MNLKERDSIKNEIALFRYGLISPIITNTYEENSKAEYFRKVASKTYIVNGKEEKYSWKTIYDWYLNYKHGGYEIMIPKTRNDACTSRKLNHEIINQIHDLKETYPHISGTLI